MESGTSVLRTPMAGTSGYSSPFPPQLVISKSSGSRVTPHVLTVPPHVLTVPLPVFLSTFSTSRASPHVLNLTCSAPRAHCSLSRVPPHVLTLTVPPRDVPVLTCSNVLPPTPTTCCSSPIPVTNVPYHVPDSVCSFFVFLLHTVFPILWL